MPYSTSHFDILPLDAYATSKSSIRRPKEITSFSYDSSHNLRHDDSSLRWYWPPTELPADLSAGFDSFIKHDDTKDEHLDSLLSAIVQLEKKIGEKCVCDIVTWRGMMTKIMCAPFDLRSGFEMNAVKFQDTIFVEENHEYKMKTRRSENRRNEIMCYWGYKFETLSTIPKWWSECTREEIEGRVNEVTNNKAQFCSVAKTGFDKIKVVIGGEVDAKSSDDDSAIYVELKTSKEIRSDYDLINFEKKLLRFWAQSFLLGVSKIIIGFRDQDGILRSTEEYETANIPTITKKSGRNLWDGNVCINFTARFITWLRDVIDEGGLWRIRHEENSSKIEVFSVPYGESFLTDEFVDWRVSGRSLQI